MKDILFGWLTKGRCYISLLDGIVFLAELGLVFLIILFAEQKICMPLKRRKPRK